VVSPDKAVIRNNLSYCCVACANGHPNHEPCHGEDRGACGCSCGSWAAVCASGAASSPLRIHQRWCWTRL